jgi:hypothetical protein
VKVTIVTNADGDWSGLYINNKIYSQDHSIRDEDVVLAILSNIDEAEEHTFDRVEVAYELLDSLPDGRFPDEWPPDGLSDEDLIHHETLSINPEKGNPRPFGLRLR